MDRNRNIVHQYEWPKMLELGMSGFKGLHNYGIDKFCKNLYNRDMIRSIKGCIFDFDGVILDTERYHYDSWYQTFLDVNYNLSQSEYESLKSTGKKKPEPEIFILALEKLGLHHDECIVFEDSIVGIKAAKRANIKTVYVGQTRTNLCDKHIEDFSDLDYEKFLKEEYNV